MAADDEGPKELRRAQERAQEIREFTEAFTAAMRALHTSADREHLDAIAFCAGVIEFMVPRPETEEQQYVALYASKRQQLGRALWTREAELLRATSREIWRVSRAVHEQRMVAA